ncbi:protein-glutamate O-methyltransferase CheR [Bacteriovorax sp. PP10]|uniref:protein-glutamate O-methyltransferase n=1 Tax=Bacteriovorax antarcticus TaxID=3088717 RepID=A0ABU5VV81_9BACT|nr:protein-glutamate O-methyltransferase CheR [Bacteriovorax sp. PP10]MEA9356966.1 protein-glutamate O-methyltransferase CheR [Bacteriovorax sp. PP10]
MSELAIQFSKDERVIKDEDFAYFQALVFKLAGITLSDKKRDLLLTRLTSHLKNSDLGSYSDYRNYLQSLPEDHGEWQNFINLMTTNKTDFFREIRHFQYIEEVLIPKWIQSKKSEINVWSAACSTGEEPYTLAMFLEAKLPVGMTYKIFASDIDTNVLAKAKNGVYSMIKESEIPEEYRKKSIEYGRGEIADWFRIKSSLKSKITFSAFNLVEDSKSDGKFDLILCRNVMIYFSRAVVEKVAINLSQSCLDDGILFIGHSESLQGTKTPWKVTTASVYSKNRR